MDFALIKLSIERMFEKVEHLESENVRLNERVLKLEKNTSTVVQNSVETYKEDVLLDTKEVLSILGVSYNTLRAIIKNKLIAPIRINQRRIRYSKKAIYAYIESKSN
jgi:predicted DNA-binding transcriptional regulator AlpA